MPLRLETLLKVATPHVADGQLPVIAVPTTVPLSEKVIVLPPNGVGTAPARVKVAVRAELVEPPYVPLAASTARFVAVMLTVVVSVEVLLAVFVSASASDT